MKKLFIAGLAVATLGLMALYSVPPAVAGGSSQGGMRDGNYDGSNSPWQFPNCIVWNPKIKYWVWVCGPPYPQGMPHT